MLKPMVFSMLEKVFETAIRHQYPQHEQWAMLYHQPILLRLEQPSLCCYLVIQPDGIIFREAHADDCVVVSIETDVTTALQMLRGVPTKGAVTIQGQAHIATLFSRYIKAYQPNVELLLANIVGEGTAYAICHQLQKAANLCKANLDHVQHCGGEYIIHECQLTPSRHALKKFYTDVDELVNRIDWIDAKLTHLENTKSQ